jgi:uncharacterized protein YkwD
MIVSRPHHAKHRKRTPAAKAPSAALTAVPLTAVPLTVGPLSAAAIAACPGAGVTPKPGNLPDVAAATSCLVNRIRAEHGLAALVDDPQLDAAAELHNADMITHDYYTEAAGLASQVDLSGAPEADVLGQSVAVGVLDEATPIAIVDHWLDSPGVVANILNPGYGSSGLAVAAAAPASVSGGLDAGTYTEDFGALPARG